MSQDAAGGQDAAHARRQRDGRAAAAKPELHPARVSQAQAALGAGQRAQGLQARRRPVARAARAARARALPGPRRDAALISHSTHTHSPALALIDTEQVRAALGTATSAMLVRNLGYAPLVVSHLGLRRPGAFDGSDESVVLLRRADATPSSHAG